MKLTSAPTLLILLTEFSSAANPELHLSADDTQRLKGQRPLSDLPEASGYVSGGAGTFISEIGLWYKFCGTRGWDDAFSLWPW